MEEKTYINICKAFSDNNRMKIFEMLRERDMCAYEILKNLNCSQPTLSYHMKLLTDSGIVNGEREGFGNITASTMSCWMSSNIILRRSNSQKVEQAEPKRKSFGSFLRA